MSSLIPVICASAAEAEYAALFMNARLGEVHRTILAAFGYPQGPTPIYCDNSTAIGLANKTVKPKQAKAMDMRFHWIRDRVDQGHFGVIWRNGPNNLADFFTKILPDNAPPCPRPTRPRADQTSPDQTSGHDIQAGKGCIGIYPSLNIILPIQITLPIIISFFIFYICS
jgi:hypothetical protein